MSVTHHGNTTIEDICLELAAVKRQLMRIEEGVDQLVRGLGL